MNDPHPKNNEVSVELQSVNELTPHNKALYEAGKQLLIESISVGREFCKFMTTTTLSAIPIYLALVKLVIPSNYIFQSKDQIIFLIPPVIFLLSAIIFAIGYFPGEGKLSLDLPSEIESERNFTIQRRQRYSIVAFVIFCLGIIISVWVVVNKILMGS